MNKLAESLNFALDDLGLEGTSHVTGEELQGVAEEECSSSYLSTCGVLLECLSHYDSRIGSSMRSLESLQSVYEVLAVREPHFTIESDLLKYRVLWFLCTHLQAERLAKHASFGSTRREKAAETGKLIFQIDKICNDLQFSPSSLSSELEIVSAVVAKVAQVVQDIPPSLISCPPKIITSPVLLSEEQGAMLKKIEEAYYDDFLLRRQMLMKRLDVTIQSFLWGEKAQGKEGEIVAAIQAQRKHLCEEPTRYTMQDTFSAPVSLLHEHSKRVTDQGGKKSMVKTVIIGAMPDRGGRANEMRPKASDYKFGGGGGRGGGGGGGGRGGGGGGGGKGGGGRVGYHHKKGGGGGGGGEKKG